MIPISSFQLLKQELLKWLLTIHRHVLVLAPE